MDPATLAGIVGLGSSVVGLGQQVIGGGGGSQQVSGAGMYNPAQDYASLAAQELLGKNTILTDAAGAAAQARGPYYGATSIAAKNLGEQGIQQFYEALGRGQTAAGITAGLASLIGSTGVGLQEKQRLAELSMGLLGAEATTDIAKTYAKGAQSLTEKALEGQLNLMQPGATAVASSYLEAAKTGGDITRGILDANVKSKLLNEQARANIAQQRASTMFDLERMRGQADIDLAKERSRRGAAFAAHQYFG
jgi:hypothetical protein